VHECAAKSPKVKPPIEGKLSAVAGCEMPLCEVKFPPVSYAFHLSARKPQETPLHRACRPGFSWQIYTTKISESADP
jgi:hypothetical protein